MNVLASTCVTAFLLILSGACRDEYRLELQPIFSLPNPPFLTPISPSPYQTAGLARSTEESNGTNVYSSLRQVGKDRRTLACPSVFAACTSRPTLSQSSTYKSSVVDLQCLLNKKNAARLTVDGYFGSLAKSAVQKLQAKYCLTTDGIVGSNTWSTLCDSAVSVLVSPPFSCGTALPTSAYMKQVTKASWNSGGKSYKTIAKEAGAAKNVSPALLVAHMVRESSLGQNNHCIAAAGKSALTGCGWPTTCSSGCRCTGTSVTSDLNQLLCTACADWKAKMEASTGKSYGVGAYTKCSSYKSDTNKMWKCIFCVYQGNYGSDITNSGRPYFTKDGTCDYAENMKLDFCKWKNYFVKYP